MDKGGARFWPGERGTALGGLDAASGEKPFAEGRKEHFGNATHLGASKSGAEGAFAKVTACGSAFSLGRT